MVRCAMLGEDLLEGVEELINRQVMYRVQVHVEGIV